LFPNNTGFLVNKIKACFLLDSNEFMEFSIFQIKNPFAKCFYRKIFFKAVDFYVQQKMREVRKDQRGWSAVVGGKSLTEVLAKSSGRNQVNFGQRICPTVGQNIQKKFREERW
jgi:hypothetical protein